MAHRYGLWLMYILQGSRGLRQAQGGPTVMRLVLPDTSLPLLESQDAALTSQPLILCPFLLVSPPLD